MLRDVLNRCWRSTSELRTEIDLKFLKKKEKKLNESIGRKDVAEFLIAGERDVLQRCRRRAGEVRQGEPRRDEVRVRGR